MIYSSRILIFLGTVLALISYSAAFFLNWGAAETSQPTPYPQYYYHQRLSQGPYPYPPNEQQPSPIPAIPIQVPLRAHIEPMAHVQNVQLVPCLCPVTQEYEQDKLPQQQPQNPENLYLKPVTVNNIKNS